MLSESKLRRQICDIGHKFYDRKYIVGTDGNLSVRLPGNVFLCTPAGTCKGDLQPDQLIKIDIEGKPLCGFGTPSSELLMHLMVYRKRSDIRAVVHAHPLTTVAMTVSGNNFEQILIAEVPIHLGKIAIAPYATPGTDKLAKSIAPFLENSDAIVLERHGLLTAGKNLKEAYYKVEWVEYAAEVNCKAKQLGQITPMKKEEVEILEKIRRKR